MTLPVAVVISGRGSNMEAIARAAQAPGSRYRVVRVIADRPTAGGLARAAALGVPTTVVPVKEFADRTAFEAALGAEIEASGAALVVLAGFMRILKGEFLRAFAGRVVNIHPSLLPAFPGLEAWKQALDYGVRVTGCTVHLVDQGVDSGPILGQETVPVLADDTAATLHERIQVAERRLYPKVVAALAAGRITIRGRQAIWQEAPGPRPEPVDGPSAR